MRHQNVVSNKRSSASPAGHRPSFFSLIILGLLVFGCFIVGFGVLCILFAPLIIGIGIALVACAVFMYAMILLVRVVGFLLILLVRRSRSTFLFQKLSPVVLAFLRQIAQQLVALLIEWLNQESPANSGPTRGSGRRKSPLRYQLLAP